MTDGAAAPAPSGWPAPTVAGPPAPQRRRGGAAATIASVTAAMVAVAGLSAWGAAPPARAGGGDGTGGSVAARMLPPDGTVTVQDLVTPNGTTLLVQEHQRATGFDALSSLPQTIGAQVLGLFPDEDQLMELDMWRIMSRQVLDGQAGPVTIDVYHLDDAGLHRISSTGGTFPSVYDPPLLVLPAAPAVGDEWDATGSALLDGALTYDYTAAVTAIDDDGCVTVESDLALAMTGEPLSALTSSDRWCPGRSVVDATGTFDQLGTATDLALEPVDDPAAEVAAVPRPAPPAALPAGDPDTWMVSPLRLAARDPFFGDMTLEGISGLPPVATDDGLVVITLGNGDDVVGLRPATAPEGDTDPAPRLVEQWRLHPGGAPLAVSVVDDLVVVSTASRTITAYGLDGVRRWSAPTDDLVLRPVARGAVERSGTETDLVIAQDLSGRLTAWRADDGSVAWRAATTADSDLAPVVLDDLLAAADRSGDLLALDLATGRERWRQTLARVDGLGVIGELLIVDTFDSEVLALDRTGSQQWAADLEVWQARIDTVGEQVALVGSEEVVVLDPTDGTVAWRLPVTEWADGSSIGLAVHRRDDVCLFDPDGNETRCWPFEQPSTAVRIYVVATPAGLWLSDDSVDVVHVGPAVEAGP